MFNREELLHFSREFQLEVNVVEKDYVLGWLKLARGVGSLYSSDKRHSQQLETM